MKKTFARIFAIALCALVLCLSFGDTVFAGIPSPSRYFYVYDEANVLSLATEDYIISTNEQLSSKCGAQIVIACVYSTGTMDIADYAYKTFNKWEIGDKDKKNGVLVVMAVRDGDYYALQGKGLENLLSSGTLKLMLDQYLEPYFSEGDYDNGSVVIFSELVKFLSEIYSINVDIQPPDQQYTDDVLTTQSVDQWILEVLTDPSYSSSSFDPFEAAGSFFHSTSIFSIIRGIFKGIGFSKIVIFVIVIIIISSLIKKRARGG